MLQYEQFKEVVVDNFNLFIPKEYELIFRQEMRNNSIADIITVKRDDIAPNLLISEMYERIESGISIETVIRESAKKIIDEIIKIENNELVIDVQNIFDYNHDIFFTLVNNENKKRFLVNKPHRDVPGTDFAIMYKKIICETPEKIKTVDITDAMMRKMGMTETDLYNMSMKDTPKLFPSRIESIDNMILNEYIDGALIDVQLKEVADIMFNKDLDIHVLTNDVGINGASVIMYKDFLQNLSQKTDNELYIIPSSIDECLLVSSAKTIRPKEIALGISDINNSFLSANKRLSNNLYKYDRKKQGIVQLTKLSNLNLDMSLAKYQRKNNMLHK